MTPRTSRRTLRAESSRKVLARVVTASFRMTSFDVLFDMMRDLVKRMRSALWVGRPWSSPRTAWVPGGRGARDGQINQGCV